jgi:hypothetical protein
MASILSDSNSTTQKIDSEDIKGVNSKPIFAARINAPLAS